MYANKKSVSMKVVVLLLAVVLLIGCVAGGTLAWLMDKTDPVVNTFTTANIDITLTETWNTDTNNDNTDDAWTAKLVPGTNIQKDPKVTVLKDSEACWLFVKVVASPATVSVGSEAKNFSDYITYSIATGWTALDATNYPGVYYREVSASTENQHFYVLKGTGEDEMKNGYVHIPDTVTKAMEDALKTENESPTLTFTAYAVQKEGFNSASNAWAQAQTLESNSGN